MTQIIYADLLFLINLLADFVIMYLTCIFSGTGCKFIRILAAAVFGACFSVIVICGESPGIASLIFVLVMPVPMCFAAFGRKSLRTFGHLIFYFFFSSVLLYGGIYAMISLIFMFSGKTAIPDKFIFTLLLLVSVFIIYLFFSSLCTRGIKSKESRIKAEVFDGHRKYLLNLLVDSGNLVKDPFSSKPVVIVSKESLSKELICALSRSFDSSEEYCGDYKDIKPRVIPVKTVSGTTLLYAFVPESMYIYSKNKKFKTDCIIAIDSYSNAFFGNDGIIPEILLQTV